MTTSTKILRIYAITVFVILILGVLSARSIPYWSYPGLDFHNIWLFHHCEVNEALWNPYLYTGAQCRDPLARDMVYPPLLYWSFVWTRVFTFPAALLLFSMLVIVGTAWSCFRFTFADLSRARSYFREKTQELAQVDRPPPPFPLVLLFILTVCQFPLAYAVERANNDVIVLLIWTGSLALFQAKKIAWAGALLGSSLAFKLYPGFGLLSLGLGYWIAMGSFRQASRLGIPMVLTGVLPFLVLWSQTVPLFSDVLPRLFDVPLGLGIHSHATLPFLGKSKGIPLLGVTLLAWILGSRRRFQAGDLPMALAGPLAIGTWFPSVSNDYNLITAYPLILLQLLRSLAPEATVRLRGVTLLGMIAIFAPRGWFLDAQRLHVILQLLWLIASGWLAWQAASRYERETVSL